MPRHLPKFQRAFFRWFEINHSRFSIPVRLKPLKGAMVKIEFKNHPECLTITANESNLGVWIYWDGEPWDGLLELDVSPVKTRDGDGFCCRLCLDHAKKWSTLEELWVDHLFEPFLKWVNKDFANAKSLRLFGGYKSTTWGQLISDGHPENSAPFFAEVPLQACTQPEPSIDQSASSHKQHYETPDGTTAPLV